MTQQQAPTQKSIRWNRVTAIFISMVACVGLAAVLWPQPPKLPMPPRIIEPPPPFVPTPEFEDANDLAVLRVVLERSCQTDSLVILSSKPDDKKTGNRSSRKQDKFPEGFVGCTSVRIVDSQEIEALFNKPYRGKRDFKHQGGWGNFYNAYPDAIGMMYLSLPSYPSSTSAVVNLSNTCNYLCGSGWEISLVKLNGKWVLHEQRPAWIS